MPSCNRASCSTRKQMLKHCFNTASGMAQLQQKSKLKPISVKTFQYRKQYGPVATSGTITRTTMQNMSFNTASGNAQLQRQKYSACSRCCCGIVSIPQAVMPSCNMAKQVICTKSRQRLSFNTASGMYALQRPYPTMRSIIRAQTSFNTASGMYALQQV